MRGRTRFRVRLLPILFIASALFVVPRDLNGQQFATDDAAVVDAGACQVEAWHGQEASWLLPACRPIRLLEFTGGVGSRRLEPGDPRRLEFVLQTKFLFRDLDQHRFAWGAVLGIGLDPVRQLAGDPAPGLFAYLPASYSIDNGRVVLHGNLGWSFEREANEEVNGEQSVQPMQGVLWGARGDLQVANRVTLIGELFGDAGDPLLGQAGLRIILVPERWQLDISFGRPIRGNGGPGPGFAVGFAWTPPPFLFRPGGRSGVPGLRGRRETRNNRPLPAVP
ncbi:MAG: hypothetical protein ACK5AZ_23265 [Bryobacteraceae bacterium]